MHGEVISFVPVARKMDCHAAARLAMTEVEAVLAVDVGGCRQKPSLRA